MTSWRWTRNDDCENFFILSRGGNYVLKPQLVEGRLDIGAPNNVVRFQTGNIPTGIVVDEEASWASSTTR